MGRMDIAHLETGAFTSQPARTECGNSALVGYFTQWIILIHELAELGRTKKLLDRRRNGACIDQILWTQIFRLGQRQTFTYGPFDPNHPDAKSIFSHLTNRSNPSITEVVDIVHVTVTVTNVDERTDHINNVRGLALALKQFFGCFTLGHAEIFPVIEYFRTHQFLAAHPAVKFHAAHGGQCIALEGEEQIEEQVLRGIFSRRLTRTHHPVDLNERIKLRLRRISPHGRGNERASIEVVHK